MTIKKAIFIIIFTNLFLGLKAQQDSTLTTLDAKVIFGFETGGTVITFIDSITREKTRHTNLRFVPHLSIYFKDQIGIGIQYEYEFVKGIGEGERPPLHGYGVYLRYYPKLRHKSKFFRSRFLIGGDIVYNISNYYSIDESPGVTVTDKLNNKRIQLILFTNWRILKSLYFVYGLRFEKDLRSEGLNDFNSQIGFQYHF